MIGLLGSMLGGRSGRMLGGMIGGRYGAMAGGLAGAMLGGRQLRRLGGLFNRDQNEDHSQPGAPSGRPVTALDDGEATVLVRAMCNAAKSDGHVDEDETTKIIGELDRADADELAFLRNELASPAISARLFAKVVPAALAAEAYAVSLMTINVDTVEEADYLRDLRDGLGLSHGDVDEIHDDLAVPRL